MARLFTQILALGIVTLGAAILFNQTRTYPLPLFGPVEASNGGIRPRSPNERFLSGPQSPGGPAAGINPPGTTGTAGAAESPPPRAALTTKLSCITSTTAKAMWESGEAVFLDARDENEFRKGHVPHAQQLGPKEFREGKPKLLKYLPEEQLYVVYCESSRECAAAEIVAGQMAIYGYRNVRVFRGGWEEWKKAGWPEEKVISESLSPNGVGK